MEEDERAGHLNMNRIDFIELIKGKGLVNLCFKEIYSCTVDLKCRQSILQALMTNGPLCNELRKMIKF